MASIKSGSKSCSHVTVIIDKYTTCKQIHQVVGKIRRCGNAMQLHSSQEANFVGRIDTTQWAPLEC